MAALKGESIKSYVLKRTLPETTDIEDLSTLENFLEPRYKNAKNGNISKKTVTEIFIKVLKETEH